MLRVIKDYDGSDDVNCIPLTAGDPLSAVTRRDAYWFWGTNDRTGQAGNFPASCVEPIPEAGGKCKDTAVNERGNKFISGMKGTQKRSGMESKVTVAVDRTTTGPNKSKRLDTKPEITKHVDVLRTENDDSLGSGKTTFMPYAEKLFRSKRDQYKQLKAIVGVVAGFIAGGILFVLLKFSFDYRLGEALAIAGGSTIVMSTCLAVSSFCRCTMALVLPNFFTGKGRAVLLSIIFGIMLSKPVANITHNAKETGSSMACMTEMLVNQSRAMQRVLAVPVQEIMGYVAKQKEDLDKATAGFTHTLNTMKTHVDGFREGVKKAEDAVGELVKDCDEYLTDVKDVCLSGCDLKIFDFCDTCHQMTGSCEPIRIAIEATGVVATAREVIQLIDEIHDYFRADIVVDTKYNSNTQTNTVLDNIQEDIYRDIVSKARAFETVIGVIKKILSVSLALIFLQSFWYLRNYLAKDGYDNIYITKQFEQLDKNSPNQILPLKEKEKGKYVMTSSVKLGANELLYCKVGMFEVLLHFMLCLLVVTFDIALHYILSQVGKYANVSLSAEAHSQFNLEVKGSGPVAEFYRIMLRNVDLDNKFHMTLNIETCLPNPSSPSMSSIPVFLVLYVCALVFVVLRGYGMRLRRKIAAYFYPEQEQARLEYLHSKIRNKRIGFLNFLWQEIKSAHKESRISEKWWNFPCLSRCKPGRNTLECTGCNQKEGSFHNIELTPCRSNTDGGSCVAVYCEDCLPPLNGVCPICSMDDMTLRK